jgi:hypothetical protein
MEQLNIESLGERIVQAARLAVAMHLYQAVEPDGKRGRTVGEPRLAARSSRQQVAIGGSGPRVVENFDDADLRHG